MRFLKTVALSGFIGCVLVNSTSVPRVSVHQGAHQGKAKEAESGADTARLGVLQGRTSMVRIGGSPDISAGMAQKLRYKYRNRSVGDPTIGFRD